jgi:queuine tRNA-ribosyltransferase
MKTLKVRGQTVQLPIFCPDATRGVVRSVSMSQVAGAGIEGLIMNTYHLMTQPGEDVIEKAGGVKQFTGWDNLIITDSGGFQVFSLAYSGKGKAKITDEGVTFTHDAPAGRQKMFLTPERCIQIQFKLNSDIMICLDDCPPLESDDRLHNKSIDRTIAWAKRCKDEYLNQLAQRGVSPDSPDRPLLFAVVQGGSDMNRRRRCYEALAEIGFDGFGYGGWPILPNGELDIDIVEGLAGLIGPDIPKYALGVGMPEDIVRCVQAGWEIFDCVLPTRDARHGRLYRLSADLKTEFLYITKLAYAENFGPIEEGCDCETCTHYSLAYVHHLFKVKDIAAPQLATIHNMRVYARLIEQLRSQADKAK